MFLGGKNMFICKTCKEKHGGNNYLHNLKELAFFSIFSEEYSSCDYCNKKFTPTALSMIFFYLPILIILVSFFLNFLFISISIRIPILIGWLLLAPFFIRHKKYIKKY